MNATVGMPYAVVEVPLAQVSADLAAGLSFVGTAWAEQFLLSLGYAYEQASRKRVPPLGP